MTGKEADRLSTGKYESGNAGKRRDSNAKIRSNFCAMLRPFDGTGMDACTEQQGCFCSSVYTLSE